MADENVNIRIKSEADNTGIKDTKQGLSGVDGEAKKAEGSSRSLTDRIKGMAVGGAVFAGLTAGVTAMVVALRKGINIVREYVGAFAQLEQQHTRIDVALRNTGQLTDDYRRKLHDLTDQLAATTATSSGDWREAVADLTFQGVDQSNMDRYLESIKNLAGITGMDIPQATQTFLRAMNGQTEMLRRYGISVETTGDNVQDLETLMAHLAERGGGVMESRLKTLEGKSQRLGEEWGNLKEAIGGLISDTGILQAGMRGLTATFEALQSVLPGTRRSLFEVEAALERGSETAQEFQEQIRDLRGQLDRISSSAVERYRDTVGEATEQVDRLRQAEQQLARQRLDLEETEALQAARSDEERAAVQRDFARRRVSLEGQQAQEQFAAQEAEIQAQIRREAEEQAKIDAKISEQKARVAQTLAELEREYQDQREENAELTGRIAAISQQMRDLREGNVTAEERRTLRPHLMAREIEDLEQQRDVLRARRQGTQRQIGEIPADIESLQSQQAEAAAASQDRIQGLRQEIDLIQLLERTERKRRTQRLTEIDTEEQQRARGAMSDFRSGLDRLNLDEVVFSPTSAEDAERLREFATLLRNWQPTEQDSRDELRSFGTAVEQFTTIFKQQLDRRDEDQRQTKEELRQLRDRLNRTASQIRNTRDL